MASMVTIPNSSQESMKAGTCEYSYTIVLVNNVRALKYFNLWPSYKPKFPTSLMTIQFHDQLVSIRISTIQAFNKSTF